MAWRAPARPAASRTRRSGACLAPVALLSVLVVALAPAVTACGAAAHASVTNAAILSVAASHTPDAAPGKGPAFEFLGLPVTAPAGAPDLVLDGPCGLGAAARGHAASLRQSGRSPPGS